MVHQYKLNGCNIVLDTCSGSVHVVDDVAYDIIALYKERSAEEIVSAMLEKYGDRPDVTGEDLRGCIEDVRALEEAGKLYTPDTFEPMAFDFKNRSAVVKALCLHVAHTCNLNCSYCFASQGKYHGDRALMSFEVGRRALDFLIENSGTRVNLEVDFFGGEPLMNWNVVKDLVAYARTQEGPRNKKFRFTLTTNGMLIDDDVIEFANKEMHNVVLSLDGRKEIHDRLRVDYAGRGSYDRIVPKFQKLVESRGGKGYYMRGTFTHANPDFTKDVFHMADLGFTELSMEPVVCAPDDPAALTEEDLPIVLEQYEILAKEMLKREEEGRGFTFYHYMLDLTRRRRRRATAHAGTQGKVLFGLRGPGHHGGRRRGLPLRGIRHHRGERGKRRRPLRRRPDLLFHRGFLPVHPGHAGPGGVERACRQPSDDSGGEEHPQGVSVCRRPAGSGRRLAVAGGGFALPVRLPCHAGGAGGGSGQACRASGGGVRHQSGLPGRAERCHRPGGGFPPARRPPSGGQRPRGVPALSLALPAPHGPGRGPLL